MLYAKATSGSYTCHPDYIPTLINAGCGPATWTSLLPKACAFDGKLMYLLHGEKKQVVHLEEYRHLLYDGISTLSWCGYGSAQEGSDKAYEG